MNFSHQNSSLVQRTVSTSSGDPYGLGNKLLVFSDVPIEFSLDTCSTGLGMYTTLSESTYTLAIFGMVYSTSPVSVSDRLFC